MAFSFVAIPLVKAFLRYFWCVTIFVTASAMIACPHYSAYKIHDVLYDGIVLPGTALAILTGAALARKTGNWLYLVGSLALGLLLLPRGQT